jgi:hemin uptake protein HemP
MIAHDDGTPRVYISAPTHFAHPSSSVCLSVRVPASTMFGRSHEIEIGHNGANVHAKVPKEKKKKKKAPVAVPAPAIATQPPSGGNLRKNKKV